MKLIEQFEEQWKEFKVLIDVLDVDVQKNMLGVRAAGYRVRRGLRDSRDICTHLLKLSIELDKTLYALKANHNVGK